MTKEQRRDRAVYRELGIRAVVRAFESGQPLDGFDGRTVRAAMRRPVFRVYHHDNGNHGRVDVVHSGLLPTQAREVCARLNVDEDRGSGHYYTTDVPEGNT